MSKTLVAYFSASGVTKGLAEKISNLVQGDIFEIEPVTPYTKGDLNWLNPFSRTTKEKNDVDFRPEVKEKVKDISSYDSVILGFPVWWYKAPNIVYTFLDENDLSGKDVTIFVTSGSSSVDGSFNKLKEAYPTINFKNGKRLVASSDENIIKTWLEI